LQPTFFSPAVGRSRLRHAAAHCRAASERGLPSQCSRAWWLNLPRASCHHQAASEQTARGLLAGGTAEDNPCAAVAQEQRLRAAFPKAVVMPVPRLVPFQGDGAAPREQLFPVVCVGHECFPQQPVMADEKGSFDGVIIIGRSWNDCGQRYEFRVFIQLDWHSCDP